MSAQEQLSLGLEPAVEEGRPVEPPEPTESEAPRPAPEATEPAPFPPTPEQAAAIDSRDSDVFLEAGAGTGKTRVLVDRYCDAIDLDGVEAERILAFTFTEKAAAEMRRRARVELSRRARAATDPERRTRLESAARAGESAPITTIHGYCRRLLSAHPVAAGLDPRFRVLDATEAARLERLAFEEALEKGAGSDHRIALAAAGYGDRLSRLVAATYRDLRNQGIRHPKLPPLQMSAFDRAEGELDPDEAELGASTYAAIGSLLELFGAELERLKGERSGVDFDDLQLVALELLETNDAVATSQSERYDHLLVDEFQDTSPIQVRLVGALCAGPARLFAVGDEFQSIYAFRGADLESFRREREGVRAQSDGMVLPLSGSFRSKPDVVAAVNAIGVALLEDFRELRVGVEPAPGSGAGSVELLLTAAGGWNEEELRFRTASPEAPNSRVAEARILAHRLRSLADEGVDPAGMVVLLRAFTGVDVYAEALELAGLDPYVVGGRGYWSVQQVSDALALLSCVANPLDDEPLLGALASPACAASSDALWILRQAAGKGRHLWPVIAEQLTTGGRERAGEAADEAEVAAEREAERERAAEWIGRLPEPDHERIERFAERLVALREQAAQLPLEALVETTLERFDYDLAALAMDDGRRRSANLAKLVAIAAEYEAHEGRDLRGFLTQASDRAALSDRESEAALANEHHAGVKVMTIHAAKGLEFDCVAVPELGRGMCVSKQPRELQLAFDGEPSGEEDPPPPSRVGLRLARAGAGSIDLADFGELTGDAAEAESEESARLVYVAATRAREHLVLSGRFKPSDVEGGAKEVKPSHSALSRILPALGVKGAENQSVEAPAPMAREGLAASFSPASIAVAVNEPSSELVGELGADLRRPDDAAVAPAAGAKPPMLVGEQRAGSAARSLSYAALAGYERCGYRFMVERVIGLGGEGPASAPGSAASPAAAPGLMEHGGEAPGDDERGAVTSGNDEGGGTMPDGDQSGGGKHIEVVPGGAPAGAAAPPVGSRFSLGRAVHELLERSARARWQAPSDEEIAAALVEHSLPADRHGRVRAMVAGWLDSPLLGELRDAGARMRPEVPFRIALGRDSIIRGTIDLLVEVPGRPPLVIDYKTDSDPPDPDAGLGEAYRLQRSLYALAISQTTGAQEVESAYVFLAARGEPIRSTLSAEEIAAGREGLERLCGAIDDRRFEVTDSPHAALCHDCPARPRLCPHPRELTLGPAA